MKRREKKDSALTLGQWITIIVAGLLVFGLWTVNLVVLAGHPNETRGTFGDMFGVVNSLFSGLAFAGIIITILLQKNELQLQRKELRQTRQEFVSQNRTLQFQRFENTLFNMLNLHNEIIQKMQLGNFKGKEVIDTVGRERLLDTLKRQDHINSLAFDTLGEKLGEIKKSVSDTHLNQYRQLEPNLNHYFRQLYHIYKFIYFSPLKLEEKNFYAALVRAQLSQNELLLIAFNGILPGYGNPNFLYLIREYDILKNFRWDDIKWRIYHDIINHEIKSVQYPWSDTKPIFRNYQ